MVTHAEIHAAFRTFYQKHNGLKPRFLLVHPAVMVELSHQAKDGQPFTMPSPGEPERFNGVEVVAVDPYTYPKDYWAVSGGDHRASYHPSAVEPKPPILVEVLEELSRATTKFPTWPTDPLHALAILGEEFGELTKAVLQYTYEKRKGVTLHNIREEAIQTAAMALRFAMSLDRYQYVAGEQHVLDLIPGDGESVP